MAARSPRQRATERERIMTIRNLEHLFAPSAVALVGASAEPGSVGLWLARNLKRGGFPGPVHFVNPHAPVIDGQRAVASVAELPAGVVLAVIATPPATIPGLVAELGARGTRAAIVVSAGIRADLKEAMLQAARPNLLRILGPNCIGLMVPGEGLDASFSHIAPPKGDLAFLSQSGALVTGILDWAAGRRIGFSHVVSLGDMADVDFGDCLDYLAGDTASRAILLYMEALTHARKFMSAARRAARVKPVIVVKAGRHAGGAKAAASHTGALSGSDAAYDAAFRRAGLLRVFALGDLFNAAEMLSRGVRLEGDRLAIVTNGGGAGVLAADRVGDLDGRLASLAPATIAALDAALPATWSKGNPVDIIGDAGEERYAKALEIVLADPGTDAVLAINCPTAVGSSLGAAKAAVAVSAAARARGGRPKPVLANWLGEATAEEPRHLFATHGIPSFETPSEAIEGFMQLVNHRRAQKELMQTPPSLGSGLTVDRAAARKIVGEVLAQGRTLLSEVEAKALIGAYDIPTVETAVAASPTEVKALAGRIVARHGAVVIKILSDDLSHKSDVGGVRLGIASAREAFDAASEMLARVHRLKPEARIRGFTVQPMVRRPRAHELILGMSEDVTFGPMLLFGAGGTAVEVLRDTSLALPPLDLKLAHDLMQRTRVFRLLEGYRDRPSADLDAIALTLVKTSQLVTDLAEVRELDINPLLADDTGVIALDARVRVADEATHPRRPMALRPYPVEWVRFLDVAGLGSIELRPIRPDDEALYEEFFRHVSATDARMRFFTPMTRLSHAHLARLTQIDYAREIAFVAIDGTGALLGVARYHADPDYTRAEYGVLVRSDLKGQGLGWRLMEHLIAYARADGLAELTGWVLAENTTMLRMCRELGFAIEAAPDDPTLRLVRLALAQTPPGLEP
jgi:acetyltransferase